MIEFKKLQDIAKALKEQTHSLADMNGISVKLGGWGSQSKSLIFTKDSYDIDGKVVTWGNKRTGYGIKLLTNNRYKTYQDATVTLISYHNIRDDIQYKD